MTLARIPTALLVAALAATAAPAAAQEAIGGYSAWIGQDDLYNSDGARLNQPWQILRQDRANYHRFGIWQEGDDWDPFFGDANNRAAMERMIMDGHIDPAAARAILRGNVMVHVTIYGRGNRGDWVEVEVWN